MTLRSHSLAIAALAALASTELNAAPLYIADPAADAIYVADTADLGVVPTVLSASGANSVGSGLAFEGILDIAVAADGSLYCLDRAGALARVLRIDTATGNRSLVLALSDPDPRLAWHDEFHALPGGKFRFVAQLRDPALPNTARIQQFFEVTEGPGNSAVAATLGSVVSPGQPLDLFASASGETLAMFPQVYGNWIVRGSTSGVARVPETLLATTAAPTYYQVTGGVTETGYTATFDPVPLVPDGSGLLATIEDFNQSSTANQRVDFASATPPSGGPLTARLGTSAPAGHSVGGNISKLGCARLGTLSGAMAAGAWTLKFYRLSPAFPTPSTTVPYRMSLWRMPHPRAHLGAALPDGTLCLAESNPPSIARMEAATGNFASRAALAPPGGSGISADDLNRLTEIEAAGTAVFAALSEDPRVLRIDAATGAMQLVTTARPGSIAAPPGGFNARSNMRLAAAPLGSSASSGSWTMY